MGKVLGRLAAVVAMAGFFTLCGCESTNPSGKSLSKDSRPGESVPVNGVVEASYISERGKRLKASFDNRAKTVTILLPSGKEITLPRTLSGSGARYSNGDEIFWEHHGVATYWIGPTQVFQGKVEETK